MAPRWMVTALLVLLAAGTALITGRVVATSPFDSALIRYTVKLADNRPGVASDLGLHLRFAAPSTIPDPFGGIAHRTPALWGIAADEEVPDGDGVGYLGLALGVPIIMDPSVCPAAPIWPLLLKVPLVDASSDSTAADYPPFLPPGNHKARWTGHIEYKDVRIPVNVLVDPRPDIASGDTLRLFVGTGDGLADLPGLDAAVVDLCFTLEVSLNVAGRSESGVPVAVNPGKPGKYIFAAEITAKPDPTAPNEHTIVLKADVIIKAAPAGYRVDVRDHNPGVATDLLMALNFRPKSPLPQPFGGILHETPPPWGIAADEEVPDGDGVGRLLLRLSVPPVLAKACPTILPKRPSLMLSIPLHDASSDSSADDFPPYLPPGEHKARWAGSIGYPPYSIPVNVLVDETASGSTTMRLFVGREHLYFRPLAKCLALDVVLHVAGYSRTGVPVAVNPGKEGIYTFRAHVITLPKPSGGRKEFDLKAEVKIEASPPPAPCLDCVPGDADGDTIVDEIDFCPQEPEDLDSYDASDGCPDSGDDDTDALVNLLELLLQSDPASADSDSDGCADGREAGPDEFAGGQRDPTNPWDFYDTNGDKIVDLPNDILGVILRYSANPALPYEVAYDRGPTLEAAVGHWNKSAADGIIDLPNDILGVILQWQHDCR